MSSQCATEQLKHDDVCGIAITLAAYPLVYLKATLAIPLLPSNARDPCCILHGQSLKPISCNLMNAVWWGRA